jgi:hypothetical protein
MANMLFTLDTDEADYFIRAHGWISGDCNCEIAAVNLDMV